MKFLNLTASNFVWNPKDCTRNFVAFVKNKTLKERVESAQNHNNSVQWDLKLFQRPGISETTCLYRVLATVDIAK